MMNTDIKGTTSLLLSNDTQNTNDGMISRLIRLYEQLLIFLVVLLPVFAAIYIYFFQDPFLVFVDHGIHKVAIGIAIMQSSFVAYVTWRCYVSSGDPLLRWITLSFIAFTLIYPLHGIFTMLSDNHLALFLLYGPASRLVMAGLILRGLLTYGEPHHQLMKRGQTSYWLRWIMGFMVLDIFIGWVALYQPVPIQTIRLAMEIVATLLTSASIAIIYLHRAQSWMMIVLTISLCYLAEGSLIFAFANPWNHLWWFAHIISAAGFTILSYGVIKAFRTTRTLSQVFNLEEVMEQLSVCRATSEESEQHFKDILDNLNTYVVLLDKNGVILEVNTATLDRSGFSSEAVIGQYFYDLPWWSYDSNVQDQLKESIEIAQHGQARRFDVAVKMRDDIFPIDFQISPVFDQAGKVVYLLPTGVDITARKQAEDLLRKSSEEIEDLYNHAPCCYHSLDKDGNILRINDSELAWLGYTRDEVIGKMKWMDLISPASLQAFLEDFPRFKKQGFTYDFMLEIIRKDGTPLVGLVNATAIYDSSGDYVMSRSMVTDITERKRMEEALREIEERNQSSLFESMQEGYAHCRMLYENDIPQDFIYLYVNDVYEKQTGLKNVVGKKVSEVIPGIRESNPELFEIYGRVALTGQLEKFETYVDKLGIWLSIAVYSPSKEHFVSVFDNITERKRTEQELIVMNNQLKHEVTNRTHELSALTAHIQRVAETERSKLARELHDDTGSIMTALSMEVGRLKGEATDPDVLQGLTDIKELVSKAVQSNRNIINQLYPTVLDDYGFVHAVNLMVKDYRKHSGIDVEIIMPNEDVAMAPDYALAAYRITQECLNNIAKHAGASKVQIEATAKDGFLDLTIHDNGKGMPRETSANRHGILGMIERARHLGGAMEISSKERAGTTAHLRLPLSVAKPAIKKRVLVADDHSIVRNALRQLLERETDDFLVEGEAKDGQEAVHMALEGAWDMMLLDITMPKKNGIKVLEEVKAAKPKLPIIMLSSHAKDEYGEIAISKGAADYVEKTETDKLVELMRRALTAS